MKQIFSIFFLFTFLVSITFCSQHSEYSRERKCASPDTRNRPSWISNPPTCDRKGCYYLGISEEKLSSEREAIENATATAVKAIITDRGPDLGEDATLLEGSGSYAGSRIVNLTDDWELYSIQRLARLRKKVIPEKRYVETSKGCDFSSAGNTYYKVFTLVQIGKGELNRLKQWKRDSFIHYLLARVEKLEKTGQTDKAILTLQRVKKELKAAPTDNNPAWYATVAKLQKRVRQQYYEESEQCDPLSGCDAFAKENVFLSREKIWYYIDGNGRERKVSIKTERAPRSRLRSGDFNRVTIKYDSELTGNTEIYAYRVQKHMASRGNARLKGEKTDILTHVSFNEADEYCIRWGERVFGESMQVAQLYQFEHALRQKKIFRDPKVKLEMVVIPDDDPENGGLILSNDNFPFRSSAIKMLLFNWKTLTYSTALQTETGNFGFRCMKEETN